MGDGVRKVIKNWVVLTPWKMAVSWIASKGEMSDSSRFTKQRHCIMFVEGEVNKRCWEVG